MNIEVSNKILLAAMPLYFADKIRKRLTMPNPKYDEAVKMKRYVGNISRELKCYEDTQEGMIIPRGFVLQLIRLATQTETSWKIIDQRRTLPEVPYTFQGELRGYQQKAVGDILKHDFGVLNAATGSGKTTMALAVIAARRQPTLIIVHTKELMKQWVDRAVQFLGVEQDEIGIIGNGKNRIGEKLTIGIVNSIYPIADEIKDKFGFVVVDEAHHCPSRTFTEAISAFDCRFMLGLSATPYRRDGLTKLIYWHLGDQVHAVDKARLIQEGSIMKPEILTRRTGFVSEYDLTTEYSRGISELTRDPERNRLIVSDVANYIQDNAGPCLVLSDRKSHCEVLAEMLTVQGIKTAILMGNLSTGKRKEVMEMIRAEGAQAIVATGSLVGEGFDLPALSALFMATPLKFSGRVTQYVGRVLRPAPSKDRAVIFDYQDINEPVLMSAARSRMKVYQRAA
jgi:superfamily II DNA or RNA helicase